VHAVRRSGIQRGGEERSRWGGSLPNRQDCDSFELRHLRINDNHVRSARLDVLQDVDSDHALPNNGVRSLLGECSNPLAAFSVTVDDKDMNDRIAAGRFFVRMLHGTTARVFSDPGRWRMITGAELLSWMALPA
jgi:hypothetical protein